MRIPATAGQRPTRSGYGSGSGAPRPSRCPAHETARAIASHGLKARNTSPTSTDANGSPTQKTTNTIVTIRLFWAENCSPASPA